MGDIFVSYSRGDEDRIAPLVSALKARGWDVFWDQQIAAGSEWRERIDRALREACCIVVVWTRRSIKDFRVAEEAEFARSRGRLLPIALDPVDLPLGLQGQHVADFVHWSQGRETTSSEQFFREVDALLKRRPETALTAPPLAASLRAPKSEPARESRSLMSRPWVASAVLGSCLIAALGTFSYRATNDPVERALRGLAAPQEATRLEASRDLEAHAWASDSSRQRVLSDLANLVRLRSPAFPTEDREGLAPEVQAAIPLIGRLTQVSGASEPAFRLTLANVDLSGAVLTNSGFEGAIFRDSNLQRVDLSHANLRGTDLRGVDLTDANLEQADLRGAHLTQSDTFHPSRPCRLLRTRLAGAKLAGADLRGANLADALGVEPSQLLEALLDHATQLPKGMQAAPVGEGGRMSAPTAKP